MYRCTNTWRSTSGIVITFLSHIFGKPANSAVREKISHYAIILYIVTLPVWLYTFSPETEPDISMSIVWAWVFYFYTGFMPLPFFILSVDYFPQFFFCYDIKNNKIIMFVLLSFSPSLFSLFYLSFNVIILLESTDIWTYFFFFAQDPIKPRNQYY